MSVYVPRQVDPTGNSVLYDKREFAWIGNGEFVGWLQTPLFIANCKSITLKLISQSPCPHFAGKLSVRLVKNGEIAASEEVTLVNSTNVSVYMIDHMSLVSMREVHRYSGPCFSPISAGGKGSAANSGGRHDSSVKAAVVLLCCRKAGCSARRHLDSRVPA